MIHKALAWRQLVLPLHVGKLVAKIGQQPRLQQISAMRNLASCEPALQTQRDKKRVVFLWSSLG